MSPKILAGVAALAILASGMTLAQTRESNLSPAPLKEDSPKVLPNTPGADILCAAVDPQTYVIGPEDILFVKVYDADRFTGPQLVRPDGKITLYLLNDFQAAGLTPERLQDQLKVALLEYMQKPEVTVTVSQVNSRKFQIQGEVNRSGSFLLATPTRVFDALGNAGGFKEFANRKDILILRADGQILHFNWIDYTKGKKRDANILLENGDTIVVN
ncbi:MAG TPA: polysaccharide biosynthesis/export family protein [Bryobacteraceae bacterium]|jgi:polysaccharide export outer membrane protein